MIILIAGLGGSLNSAINRSDRTQKPTNVTIKRDDQALQTDFLLRRKKTKSQIESRFKFRLQKLNIYRIKHLKRFPLILKISQNMGRTLQNSDM